MTVARPRFRFVPETLPGRFLAAGALVMIAAGWVVGSWVSGRIEQGVVQNSATSATLYVESFLTPLSEDLAISGELSVPARKALEEIFATTALGEQIVSYKIWKPGGLVVEASDPALRGQVFEPSEDLQRAWRGHVAASFQDLHDHEDEAEAALGIPLLEVYSPVRATWTGEVVAVAEFYQRAEQLAHELAAAKRVSWLVTAASFGVSGLLLYGIVAAGGRTIQRQQTALRQQLDETRRISAQNLELRQRVAAAAQRTTAQADRVMQRIGQDLHDGVAQHLSLASLRFDEARPGDAENAATVRDALKAAMTELRAISRGLALPELEQLTLAQTIERAVRDHSKAFGTNVAVECNLADSDQSSQSIRLCVYRFVQEALSNAQRHSGADKVAVRAKLVNGSVEIVVEDDGSGFDADAVRLRDDGGQGLHGLHDRAATLGGSVRVESEEGAGTQVTLVLPLKGEQT